MALRVRGLDAYLDNKATKPEDPAVQPPDEQVMAILDEEVIVLQQIVSTIPDALYLKIKGKTVSEAWKVLKDDFEKRYVHHRPTETASGCTL